MKNIKPWMVFFSVSILTLGCNKTPVDKASAQKNLLSQSAFYSDEAVPRTTGEAGFITPPTQAPSSAEGGSIAPPGTVAPQPSSSPAVVSSSSPATATASPTPTNTVASSTTTNSTPATVVSITTTASGSTSSAAPSTAPADGGFIPSKPPVSGADSGSVPASSTGTFSTQASTSQEFASTSTNASSPSSSTASSSVSSSSSVPATSTASSSATTPVATQSGTSPSGTGVGDSGAIPKNGMTSTTDSGSFPNQGASSSGSASISSGNSVTPASTTLVQLVDKILDLLKPKPVTPGKEPIPASPGVPNIWKLFEPANPPCDGGTKTREVSTFPNEKFSLKINRICSVRRSRSSSLFFEDAHDPILSIEAVTQTKSGNHLIQVVEAISLKGIDLLQSRVIPEITFNLAEFKKRYPKKWKSAELRFSVCNDPKGKGSCLMESTQAQLTLTAVTSKINHIPNVVTLDVWNGRDLTLKQNPEACEKQYSPIVLDLTGNGVHLSGPEDGVRFDLNATGTPLLTGWINSKENGFLVRDLDADKDIESGAELFGSATMLKNGQRAVNGFEALKDLDDNKDNLFDSRDSAWKDLRVWIDRDFNGESERGEVLTLDQLNIEQFNLDYAQIMEVDPFGNQTRQRSTYWRKIRGKSTPLLMVDVWFVTLSE